MKLKALLFSLLLTATAVAQNCGDRFYQEVFTNVNSTTVNYGQNTTNGGTNQTLSMDIYQPVGDTFQYRPLLIWVHGGSFLGGSKNDPDVQELSQAFAKRGYVTASINYRLGISLPLNRDNTIRAVIRAVHDLKAAIRYFRQDFYTNGNVYKIDPEQIFIGGSSAGAITALHTAYLDNYPEFQNVADSTIIINLGGVEGNSGNPGYSSKVKGVVNLCGGIGKANWQTPNDPPGIHMHGTADNTVPYATNQVRVSGIPITGLFIDGSYVVDSFAQTIGLSSHLYTWNGAGHVPYVSSAAEMTVTKDFVTTHLAPLVDCSRLFQDLTSAEVAYISNNLRFYPNPANETLYLNLAADKSVSVQLMDLTGRTLKTWEIRSGESPVFSISDLASGVYVAKFQSGNQIWQQKLIKE